MVTRIRTGAGALADVPGLAFAVATTRAGDPVAVRVLLHPGTDAEPSTADGPERWLLVQDLVDPPLLDTSLCASQTLP